MKSDDRYLCEFERNGGTLQCEEDDRDLDRMEENLVLWRTLYNGTWESTKVVPTSDYSATLERFRACRAKLHRATAEIARLRAENAVLRSKTAQTLWDNGL